LPVPENRSEEIMGKKQFLKIVPLFFLLWTSALSVYGQQRPFHTDDADTLPFGTMRFQIGLERMQSQIFSLSELKGNLSRFGDMAIQVGAGGAVEFQASGDLWNRLKITRRLSSTSSIYNQDVLGDTTGSVGDLLLATKFRLIKERIGLPAVAFRFGVELPNASNENGLGNDETNFYATLMAAKSVGRLRTMVNLGMAILGNPVTVSSQHDMLTYGLAGIYQANRLLDVVGEFYGRAGDDGPGAEVQSLFRLGIRAHTGGICWDLSAVKGLAENDPSVGVSFGVSYQFSLFR
jgi:hypothetical protein